MCKSLCMSTWDPREPYNDLPPIPHRDVLETATVLRAAIGANAALARLDQAASAMPNPAVLINSIPLLEAQASSEIENIVTTTDALFRHVDDDSSADAATRETLRYRSALRTGSELAAARGITVNTARAVCTSIKGRDMWIRSLPGTRIGNPVTGDVAYSPPEGSDLIRAKLSDWEHFVHDDDGPDTLVKMAAAHYQFEAIHPFADGNGRTGRILNVLMLVEAGLITMPLLYLSRYIISTKSEYYARLLAVTAEGAWEAWLLYILKGVETTSLETVAKIRAVRALQDDFAHHARDALRSSVDVELFAVLFEQPYCRISNVVERCHVSRPTATKWLRALAARGLLREHRAGREVLFINHAFLDLLAS